MKWGSVMTETAVQQEIRLAAAEAPNVTLWRNNVGAAKDDTGRLIRYGLGNDSAKINRVFKSPDLVGFRTIQITGAMAGQHVAQFIGCEVKPHGWTLRPGDDRAQAQLKWIQYVIERGGWAGFATSVDDFKRRFL